MRLDAAVAARGLARSRTHAQSLIAEGLVFVDGNNVVKVSTPVSDDTRIEISATTHYVSRGALKLLAALDAFEIDVAGRVALDMGASTGGFTQVLRERGAALVVAVDVGQGQLSEEIARDAGVVSIEGFNVRDLTPDSLAAAAGRPIVPEIVTGDLSFISLRLVVPRLVVVTAPDADILLLVKPQFEVGREAIREGIVTDPALRADAIHSVLWAAWDVGLGCCGIVSSPILGSRGNAEYLVHLRPGSGRIPSEWTKTIAELTGEG